jgi:seryl-tRNA synthetase
MLKIQNNLDSIKELEKIVTLNRPSGNEGAQSMDEKIMDDIKLLYLKMEQNKLIIAKMEKDLKNSSIYNAQLVKMVERLKKDLSAKEEEIVKLKDELAKSKIYIDELIADVDKLALEKEGLEETVVKKEEEIAAKDDEMHTAYWIVGTAKELKEKGVMTKEGGFIGIGRAKKLSGSVDLNKLTKINTKEVKNIAIGGKKAELISPHPAGTYEWKGEKKKDGLVITDHEGFWRNSKVLVIVVD